MQVQRRWNFTKTGFKSFMGMYLPTLLLTELHIQLLSGQKIKHGSKDTAATLKSNLGNIRKTKIKLIMHEIKEITGLPQDPHKFRKVRHHLLTL